jgi:hypothetical protein
MEELTSNQFNEMARPTKASTIINCIKMIEKNTIIKIDGKEITELDDFVSWLLDNLN